MTRQLLNFAYLIGQWIIAITASFYYFTSIIQNVYCYDIREKQNNLNFLTSEMIYILDWLQQEDDAVTIKKTYYLAVPKQELLTSTPHPPLEILGQLHAFLYKFLFLSSPTSSEFPITFHLCMDIFYNCTFQNQGVAVIQ